MTNIAQLLTEHMAIWTAADTVKKSGRGRASGNAGSVYGVKKLRELILELAVRGKLVPQDTNDEPARELLKRIQAEKAKLILEGKLKKEKLLAPISEDEKPFEQPKGWEWVRFQDISTYIQRGKGPEYVDASPYIVVSQKCVRWLGIDLNVARYISPESLSKYEEVRFLKNNDLLWNSTGTGTIGRACLYQNSDVQQKSVADSHVTIVRTLFGIDQFLFRYIQSPTVQNEIETMASGTTNQIELNTSTVIAHLLPLPPLAEQHRIVAKVDELMALCDQLEQQHSNAQEAHETLVSELLATLTQSQNAVEFNTNWQRIYTHFDVLFTTEASIDALKQTLLQLAVMGKLVPQDPNDEPASELLKRIQAEKAKLIAEGKLKKEKPLAPIAEDEKPFELPKGWEWTSLLNAAVINPRNAASDDIKASFVPMTLIGSAFTDKHQDEKRLWKEIKQGFTHFAEGDIGVAKITPCFENSKACVFENLENGLGAGTTELHIVRPIMNTLSPRYVLAYLKSPRFLKLGESKMTGTAGQKRLPKDFVETNPFPLPPLAEQHRIVAKVDALMALCDQLKTRIQQANQQQQKVANVLVVQGLA